MSLVISHLWCIRKTSSTWIGWSLSIFRNPWCKWFYSSDASKSEDIFREVVSEYEGVSVALSLHLILFRDETSSLAIMWLFIEIRIFSMLYMPFKLGIEKKLFGRLCCKQKRHYRVYAFEGEKKKNARVYWTHSEKPLSNKQLENVYISIRKYEKNYIITFIMW